MIFGYFHRFKYQNTNKFSYQLMYDDEKRERVRTRSNLTKSLNSQTVFQIFNERFGIYQKKRKNSQKFY